MPALAIDIVAAVLVRLAKADETKTAYVGVDCP